MKEADFLDNGSDFLIKKDNLKEIQNELVKTYNMLIILCVKGSASIEVNLQKRFFYKNEIVLIIPGCSFKLFNCTDDFLSITQIYSNTLVHESLIHLEHIIFPFLLKNFHTILDEKNRAKRFNDYIEVLQHIYSDKECLCQRELISLQLRFNFLYMHDQIKRKQKEYNTPSIKTNTRAEQLFKDFMNELVEHCQEYREVSIYANNQCISTKYLNTIAKKITNKTAKELIDERTIMQLKIALRASNKSLQDITDEFHFPNQSYMGRYFKKHTHSTPSEYRKQEII